MTLNSSDIESPLHTPAPDAEGAHESARAAVSLETLRQTELKYRSMFEHATHGISQPPPEVFATATPASARMLGYDPPADMIAACADIADSYYVNPADRDKFLRLVATSGLM